MIFSVNSNGQKNEYFSKFVVYYSMQLQINNDPKCAFEFAQAHFLEDYGFILYKEIDRFLNELIEIKDE